MIKEVAGWKDMTEDLRFQFVRKASPSCQECCQLQYQIFHDSWLNHVFGEH
ncbi:hypothetical protein SNOG_20126 [Parastagonospora nodorum SN15]|uniref:Uncharacterized protein n=1 Tax=Phaeosphaeria nodorum (strain SN15 / ATCC MYA-4574 / FGSC 10173) TaxID=321614 RepID=A9JXC2_PHANO|nr:hypothetical protein SNOG_20126 [Parastagonospora nodorum SN15]EDP89812.1 hypothetical protein SNOG_20126 [Parastagonospora nodorum SN15]